MYRNLPKQPGDGSDGSPPSEAWLIAQAILGKPIPRIVNPKREARAKREELERLAQFSSTHAEELRRLQSAEAEARRERELLEWAAQFSTECESKLRALLREEAEAREGWRRAEQFTEMLLEGTWDSSKHPRLGGPPNPGWWASTDGADRGIGHVANDVPVSVASYSGPKRVVAQQVSAPRGVGHHWAPYSIVFRDDIRSLLSDDAIAYHGGVLGADQSSPQKRDVWRDHTSSIQCKGQ